MRWPDSHRHLHTNSRGYYQARKACRLVPRQPNAYLQRCSVHITPDFECFTKTVVCLGTDIESLLCRSCHSPITATCLVSDHG